MPEENDQINVIDYQQNSRERWYMFYLGYTAKDKAVNAIAKFEIGNTSKIISSTGDLFKKEDLINAYRTGNRNTINAVLGNMYSDISKYSPVRTYSYDEGIKISKVVFYLEDDFSNVPEVQSLESLSSMIDEYLGKLSRTNNVVIFRLSLADITLDTRPIFAKKDCSDPKNKIKTRVLKCILRNGYRLFPSSISSCPPRIC